MEYLQIWGGDFASPGTRVQEFTYDNILRGIQQVLEEIRIESEAAVFGDIAAETQD